MMVLMARTHSTKESKRHGEILYLSFASLREAFCPSCSASTYRLLIVLCLYAPACNKGSAVERKALLMDSAAER